MNPIRGCLTMSLLTTGIINMGQVLYLFCKATMSSGSTTMISVWNVDSAILSSGNYKSGMIYKSEYLQLPGGLLHSLTSMLAHQYASTSLGRIPFQRLVYIYSKILSFYGKKTSRVCDDLELGFDFIFAHEPFTEMTS